VNSTALQVLLYALVAGASPLALASTLVLLHGTRARWRSSAFAVGVVLGQAAVCGLAFAVGAASVPGSQSGRDNSRAALELVIGVALLAGSWYARYRYTPKTAPTSSRSKAALARLDKVHTPAAFGTGTALGIGGPKRLGITLIVAATIAASGWSGRGEATLALAYVVIATAVVWGPVSLALVFGARAAGWMETAQAWLTAHRQLMTVRALFVLGVLATVDAIVALVT
jgi:Sap, sulfolipid-1-addressing protein